MRRIGIDFGTCNIKGAEKKKNGDVTPLKLGKKVDKKMIPNVVLYEKKGDRVSLVGDIALSKAAPESDKIRNIKSFLQERNWERKLSFDETVNAYEVTADIMKSLYEGVYNTNKNEELTATITVPVIFSRRQQLIVEKAAKEAGFHVDSVITEPFAALFFLLKDYFDEIEEDHNVLIFDFGGGTLDLCLVKIRKKQGKLKIETEATTGILYGGNHISLDILENILRKNATEELKLALDDESDVFHAAVNRYFIMETINELKETLFSDEREEDEEEEIYSKLIDSTLLNLGKVSVNNIYQMFHMQGWEGRIERILSKLFEDSEELLPDDVTDIFLVGGSSSIPYFRNELLNYFKKNKHSSTEELFVWNDELDSEERIYHSVSCGAAIFNEIMSENEIEIRDRIPFLIYSKDEGEAIYTKLSFNTCFKDYRSALAPITDCMKTTKKIEIYQTLFGEEEKDVHLGDMELTEEIINENSLYRLLVDKDRNIQIEFGNMDVEYENAEDAFCSSGIFDFEIRI